MPQLELGDGGGERAVVHLRTFGIGAGGVPFDRQALPKGRDRGENHTRPQLRRLGELPPAATVLELPVAPELVE